ncbi:class III poly(R)-hydroxyalkanoic acid synthase PhaE subunit [Tahibacter aquaticus]|uniref:Poly(3-hydroxyalkanoate) polymerase subunit PhaE n=1 Tax=Tahibacter aquaticus TaxID=520092 RepID=A0A4V3DLJ9_9GAMM|nr:class III poly(R)-hydroxyalkanoic acid synthase subunit PhaE [Tahibacter aquaticus]TDR39954.1 class III poly(R)-hydroxyalkanoic acid synthase PhaE subunit [Tahibacter aquaticus]
MSNSAQDWMNQWQALAQRYWDGWKSQGVTPPAGFGKLDANAPWQAALDQWSQLFGKGNSQSDVVDRVTANAKSYVSLMQSMLNSSLGQGGDGSAAAWTEALRNGFNIPGMDPAMWNNPLGTNFRDMAGQGAKGFEQLMAEFSRGVGPFKQEMLSGLGMPAFGLAREHQERWQALGTALVEYQEQTNRYNTLILKSSQQGFERFQSKLAEREEPGRQLDSVRAVYDLWIDSAEEAYGEIALSDEFRKVYGAMVNAQMRVRSLMQLEVEQQTRQLGIPTRTELKGVEKSVQELRRNLKNTQEAGSIDLAGEIAALRAEVAALKQQLADARPAAGKPAESAPVASKPAAGKPAAADAGTAAPTKKTKR